MANLSLVAALTAAGAAALANDRGVRLTDAQRTLRARLRDDGPGPAAGATA